MVNPTSKTIAHVAPLLIGDLQAGTAVNDQGVTYIGLGPITDDDDSGISIDNIEAAALYEWLGRALGVAVETTPKPARDADHCDYPDCEQHNALVVQRLTADLKNAYRVISSGHKPDCGCVYCARSQWPVLPPLKATACTGCNSTPCVCAELLKAQAEESPWRWNNGAYFCRGCGNIKNLGHLSTCRYLPENGDC